MEIIRKKGGAVFCALFIYLIATSFINQDVYAFTVKFASVLIFAVLCVLMLPYLAEDLKNRAVEPVLVGLTVILSTVFVIITRSGYGALFIPSDLALICYASGHIRLTGKEKTVTAFAGAIPVGIWYSHVRWSYNFNMAGFAFMLMAFFGMLLTERVAEHVRIKGKRTGDRQRQAMEAMFFITAFILSMLYHSRTAMFGMLMFAL
ncbi:MAG: hypothetical protein K6G42_01485, partial [Lachnospiraceae bacterium]|nr:hypothetical protein [Lachnospiraceae bacterium]